MVAGTTIVGAALLWAFWPRAQNRLDWLAPPTGEAGDSTPGGTRWQGGHAEMATGGW